MCLLALLQIGVGGGGGFSAEIGASPGWPSPQQTLSRRSPVWRGCARNGDLAARLAWAQRERAAGRPTVPSTLGDEMRTNLYMRTVLGTLGPVFGERSPADLMRAVYDAV